MTVQHRIALVGTDDAVRAAIPAAARRVVRCFVDLHAELPAIAQFHPQVLVWCSPEFGERELGTADLLAALLPGTQLVALVPADQEALAAPHAAEHGVQLLTLPLRPEAVAALLAADPATLPAGLLEPLAELVTGLTDTLNNPLQVAHGHLQLLRSALPADQPDLAAHVDAVRDALARVDRTLASLRRVGHKPAPGEPVCLTELAAAAAAGLPQTQAALLRAAPAPPVTLRLARAAWVDLLVRFVASAAALSAPARPPELGWSESEAMLQASVHLPAGFPAWKLPATFAPFLLTRVLHESPQVLELFLMQILAAAHGGAARVRRLGTERLRLELLLPRTA